MVIALMVFAALAGVGSVLLYEKWQTAAVETANSVADSIPTRPVIASISYLATGDCKHLTD